MKLLIIRSGALGDTLMLMPLISALSGEHEITILGRKPGIDFLESCVEQCIDIERGRWHRLFSRVSDIDIPCPQVDHVIAFINDKENIVVENLSHLFSVSKINIFPPFPAPESQTHVALYMAGALQSSGIAIDPRSAIDATLNKPVIQSSEGGGNKVVLHPGSGSEKKNYSPDFWFRLVEQIKKSNPDSSFDMCFLLGPAEEDIFSLVERKAAELGAEIACPYGQELISLLNKACLYIGHDSGVTHLAAMLGVNTVALFKNSSVEYWRPLGPFVKIVSEEGNEESILEVTVGEASAFLKNAGYNHK